MPCPCGNSGSHNEVDGPIAATQLFSAALLAHLSIRQPTDCIVSRGDPAPLSGELTIRGDGFVGRLLLWRSWYQRG